MLSANPLNPRKTEAIALTFDIDWAPDFAIEDLLRRLDDAKVKATLFVTHETQLLKGLDPRRFELGLHPHLPDKLDLEAALAKVMPLAPEAVGVRFHRLIQSTPLMYGLRDAGLHYDASMLLPYQPHLRPFAFPHPFLRIPYGFEDDVHAALGHPFRLESIGLASPGLKIFDFHPIHTYLNMEKLERYSDAKSQGFSLKACRALRNPGAGAGSLLDDLLMWIRSEGILTYQLQELTEAVRKGEIPDGAALPALSP